MRRQDVFPYYRNCVTSLSNAYDLIRSRFDTNFVDELAQLRGYVEQSQLALIADMELGCCAIDDVEDLGDMRKELGLVSTKDNFLLGGRYIIPVDDIAGNLVALIGYYPDVKKYITTPSPFFSKECMFFNYKQAFELSWREFNGFVILVEGIFDCLSLRSIGLPAIATMGSSVSALKCELLKSFRKVLAIPDDDKTGRKALNRYSRQGWKVPYNTTFLKFYGSVVNINGNELHCKDMDNFVSWYEPDDVREILLSYANSREDIEELIL